MARERRTIRLRTLPLNLSLRQCRPRAVRASLASSQRSSVNHFETVMFVENSTSNRDTSRGHSRNLPKVDLCDGYSADLNPEPTDRFRSGRASSVVGTLRHKIHRLVGHKWLPFRSSPFQPSGINLTPMKRAVSSSSLGAAFLPLWGGRGKENGAAP